MVGIPAVLVCFHLFGVEVFMSHFDRIVEALACVGVLTVLWFVKKYYLKGRQWSRERRAKREEVEREVDQRRKLTEWING